MPVQSKSLQTIFRLIRFIFGNSLVTKDIPTAQNKIFGEPQLPDGTLARLGRNEGVRKMVAAERKGLGYSKDLATHTAAVAMFLGIYNFVRTHKTLETTPAVASGVYRFYMTYIDQECYYAFFGLGAVQLLASG